MQKLFVDLKKDVDDSYEIHIGRGFVSEKIDELNKKSKFFVIDSNVYNLYPFFQNLQNVYVFEASEKSKTIESVEKILVFLKNNGCLRDSILLAVGGGIVGDVAGFAASIYMRGIDYYQIPTTLLSMVDSSVGGKTGVNLYETKNLIGTFYQPKAVFIDMDFLNTLSDEEYKNGLAEVIKYALMFDEKFYSLLDENSKEIEDRQEILESVVYRCCEIKAKVVKEDEKEHGLRMFLNFGHTFGHAIEIDSNHTIKHGFAVATGMYLETLFGHYIKKVNDETALKVKNILNKYSFELKYSFLNEESFLRAIASDKKARQSGISVALTPKVGSGIILKGVGIDLIKEFFVSLRS